jgi:hypothetical protein
VIARCADCTAEVPLTTGDVIRTLNGVPMTTLDRVRNALQPPAPVLLSRFKTSATAACCFCASSPTNPNAEVHLFR